jgi:hypothetical protein
MPTSIAMIIWWSWGSFLVLFIGTFSFESVHQHIINTALFIIIFICKLSLIFI